MHWMAPHLFSISFAHSSTWWLRGCSVNIFIIWNVRYGKPCGTANPIRVPKRQLHISWFLLCANHQYTWCNRCCGKCFWSCAMTAIDFNNQKSSAQNVISHPLRSHHGDATQRQSELSLVMKYLSSCELAEYALDLSIVSKQKYVFMRIMNNNNKKLTGCPSYQLALTVTHQFILLYRTHAHHCNYDLYWFVYTRFPSWDIHTFFFAPIIFDSISHRKRERANTAKMKLYYPAFSMSKTFASSLIWWPHTQNILHHFVY